MGKIITDPDKLSIGTKEKIRRACNKSIKVRFSQWYKKYQYENSPTGSSMINIIIDTKDFDRDPIKVAEELIRLRLYYAKQNKKYIPPTNLEELNKAKKNNKIKETQDIMNTIIDTFIPETGDKIVEVIGKTKLGMDGGRIRNLPLKGLARYGIVQQSDFNVYQPGTGASTIAVMGSGQTGKTTLMELEMKKLYDNDTWLGFLYTLSPHIKAFETLKYIKVRPAFNYCDEMMIEMMKDLNVQTDNKYRFINFFDDILEEGTKHNKVIDRLCLIYRNSMLSTWLSTQYPKLISKKNRSNINSYVLFRFHQMDFLEEVIKSYLKPYFRKILGTRNIDEMIDLYHVATEDHGFIYVSPFQDTITFHKLKL